MHEQIPLTSDFSLVERVGYLGGRRDTFVDKMNELYGPRNWTIGYLVHGKIITRDEALTLYEKSYEQFFTRDPEYTRALLVKAKDVYDTSLSNLESGFDWHKQEVSRSHLQDIAVRRAIRNLGLEFKGQAILQIRGKHSDLPELNPGKIPFIHPEAIISPPEFTAPWIAPGSVEDFWQNNKFMFIHVEKAHNALAARLGKLLAIGAPESADDIGRLASSLILSGHGGEARLNQFEHFVRRVKAEATGGEESPVPRLNRWIFNLLKVLDRNAGNLNDVQILERAMPLSPLIYEIPLPELFAWDAASLRNTRVQAGLVCATAKTLDKPHWGTLTAFEALLQEEGVWEVIERSPDFLAALKKTGLITQGASSLENGVLDTCYFAGSIKDGLRRIANSPN